jgi:hypothetical protein
MTVYRAMCEEEMLLWVNDLYAWKNRFKWFSPNIEFIKTRVQDNKFNNSKHKTDAYKYILEFNIIGDFRTLNVNEIQVDRRSANMQFIKIV